MGVDEREAIDRLRRGDIGGLELLVRRYQWEAVRVATLILRDPQLAEDVAQDAFVRVFERIDQFDAARPFAPWFFRIVANNAIKLAQRRQRQVNLPHVFDQISDMPTPPDMIEVLEQFTSIQTALDQLPPAQRAAVVMRYYLGLTDHEAAERLGSTRGTIKWRLHEARRRLRTLLRPTAEPDPEPPLAHANEEHDR
jgi:RNA polymerase sigma-70 factor (ECF subfamily)